VGIAAPDLKSRRVVPGRNGRQRAAIVRNQPITTMKTTTNYNVTLHTQDWDSRGQQWHTTGSETLHTTSDLDAAKSRFREEWEKREAHASTNRCPVELELVVVATDADGDEEHEAYSADPAPNGDATWHCFYDGADRDGWFVLWAKRDGGYAQDPFGIIGHHQKQHFSTGEWALRYCKDERGAIYAEALFQTAEELAAYFHADVPDVYHTQARLQTLADLGALTGASVPATWWTRDGHEGYTATLPDGTEYDSAALTEPCDAEGETRYAFGNDGKLYAVEVPYREEEIKS